MDLEDFDSLTDMFVVNPFVSEAQRRWMHTNDPEMAERWEDHTPKGKKLPEKVSSKRKKAKQKVRNQRLTTNKRRKPRIVRRSTSPQKGSKLLSYDPTRTTTLRRAFCAQVNRMFARLAAHVMKLIGEDDVLGIDSPRGLSSMPAQHSKETSLVPTGNVFNPEQERDENGRWSKATGPTLEGYRRSIGDTERQHVVMDEHKSGERTFLTAFKKDAERNFLDPPETKTVEATIDPNPKDKTLYLNRIDALKGGKGYAAEVLRNALDHYAKRGYKSATAYVQFIDDASQRIMVKLGGAQGQETKSGRYWHFDLTKPVSNCQPGQMRGADGKCGPGISLGISRETMPQIPGNQTWKLVQWLRMQGIGVSEAKSSVGALSPTQVEFSQERVDAIPEEKLLEPILISQDDYILDGTHSWVKAWQKDRMATIPTIKIALPVEEALEYMRRFAGAKFAANFDPGESRDTHGRWTSSGAMLMEDSEGTDPHRLYTGPKEVPVKCGKDIERAAVLLSRGYKVRLSQPKQLSTLLDKMYDMTQEAVKRGEEAPNFDLCNVSVKGTNLFCQESKGIPRVQMPQLKGEPAPGSYADTLPKNKKGKVDLSADFIDHLKRQGIGVTETKVPASQLRASQNEIVGGRIAQLVKEAEAGTRDLREKPIFVTRDNYVCVDEETEILTQRGWLNWKEAKVGDVSLTLNHTTGLSEWKPILALNIYPPQRRDLLLMEGNSHSSLTTLDHKWPVVYLKAGNGGMSGAVRRWRKSGDLTVHDSLVVATECDSLPKEPIYDDALVELVAWAWTEGSIRPNGKNLHISQSHLVNKKHCESIRTALTNLFGKPRDSLTSAISRASIGQRAGFYYDDEPAWAESLCKAVSMSIFRLTVSASASILEHLDVHKVVKPEFLASLTEHQLSLFVERCIDADGCRSAPSFDTFVQKSEASVKAFQMACALLGKRTCASWREPTEDARGYGCFYTTISHDASPKTIRPIRRARRKGGFRVDIVSHNGMVWCPTTDNRSWLARRKGTVYYTGNCDGHHHWAAIVGLGAKKDKDFKVPVHMLDCDIGEALEKANAFTKAKGIAPKAATMAANEFNYRPFVCNGQVGYVNCGNIIEVPDIRQRDHFSCGAACSMSVGQYFGIGPSTLEEWKKILGTDAEESTHPQSIVDTFKKMGCEVESKSGMTLDDLSSFLQRDMPVIVCVQDYGPRVPKGARFEYGHYIVVIGRMEGHYIFCQDPSEDNVIAGGDNSNLSKVGSIQKPGRIMIAEEDFLKVWHDKDVDGNKYIRWGCAIGRGSVVPTDNYDPGQPRDDHGRFSTGAGEASSLSQKVRRLSGFTYKPVGSRSPKEGFIVSLPREAGWEKPIPEEEFKSHGRQIVLEYLKKVRESIRSGQLDKEHAHVGAWHDKSTGRVVLDVNEVFPTKKEAIDVGLKRKQDAIFDLGGLKEIDLRHGTRNTSEDDWRRDRRGIGTISGADGKGVEQLANNVSVDALKKADFVHFPKGLTGTNCGNCQFQEEGICQNSKLRGLPVTPKDCCAYWDAKGVTRPWSRLADNYSPDEERDELGRWSAGDIGLKAGLGALKDEAMEKATAYLDKIPGAKWLREKVASVKEGIEARYGAKTAGRIFAVANAISWGAFIVGPVVGYPNYIPATWLMAAGAGVAEVHYQYQHRIKPAISQVMHNTEEMPEDEVRRLARQMVVQLAVDYGQQIKKSPSTNADWNESEHPRDKEGRWTAGEIDVDARNLTVDSVIRAAKSRYPKISNTVDGRFVLPNVDNKGSITSSLDNYKILPGIREVPLSDFQSIRDRQLSGKGEVEHRVSADDERKVESLVSKISESNKISPLIVVDDGHPDGPYVLEGGHRLDAMERLKAKSIPALVVLDLDGISRRAIRGKLHSRLVTNAGEWRVVTDSDKIKLFQQWIAKQLLIDIIGLSQEQLWQKYIQDGLQKGAGRAFDDSRPQVRAAMKDHPDAVSDFYKGTKYEFLRSAFNQPVAVEKVKLLASRTFDELKNVTNDMSNKMSRILTDGLVQGKGPRDIARDLVKQVGLSAQRATLVARTEIVRAHANGQLLAYKALGVTELGVAVEWSTAGDDRVCPQCEPLDGVVLNLDEAEGLIPRHPACRCAFIPSNVAEKRPGQIRSKEDIEDAFDEADLDADVGSERPEPIINAWEPILDHDEIIDNEADDIAIAPGELLVNDEQEEQLFRTLFQEDFMADNRGGGICRIPKGTSGGGQFSSCDEGGETESSGETKGPAEPMASEAERKQSLALAKKKIANVPVPSAKAVEKARRELDMARKGLIRAGGYAGGNATDRKRQRYNLFVEWGGKEKGYVACPWTGLKLHWSADPKDNPQGYPVLERGKIMVKCQGGGYQLANLLPESFTANRSRGDKRLRAENSEGC